MTTLQATFATAIRDADHNARERGHEPNAWAKTPDLQARTACRRCGCRGSVGVTASAVNVSGHLFTEQCG